MEVDSALALGFDRAMREVDEKGRKLEPSPGI
jgi:hypothetical protein